MALAPALQAALEAGPALLAANMTPSGQVTGLWFTFDSLGLKVKLFQDVDLTVRGATLVPADAPADAVDDGAEVGNDKVLSGIDVLGNDSVPDLAASVVRTEQPDQGTPTFHPDGTFDFDPFSGSFGYEVTDANGATDTVTATVVVEDVGTFEPRDASSSATDTAGNGQEVTATVTAPTPANGGELGAIVELTPGEPEPPQIP